jgi:hypothetical protein
MDRRWKNDSHLRKTHIHSIQNSGFCVSPTSNNKLKGHQLYHHWVILFGRKKRRVVNHPTQMVWQPKSRRFLMVPESTHSSPWSISRTTTSTSGASIVPPTTEMSFCSSFGRHHRRPTSHFQNPSCQLPHSKWTNQGKSTKQWGVIVLTRIGVVLVAVGILHNYWISRPRLPWYPHRMVVVAGTMANASTVSSEGHSRSSRPPPRVVVVPPEQEDQITLRNTTTQGMDGRRYGSLPFDMFFLKPIVLPTLQQDKPKTSSAFESPSSLKLQDDSSVNDRNSSNKKERTKLADNPSWTKIPTFANHQTTTDDTITRNGDVPPNCITTWMTLDDSHKTINSTTSSPEYYPHAPVLVPSFPGSGTEMFRTLIRTMLPGFDAASIFEPDQCRGVKVATCKTHWPVTYQQRPTQWVVVNNDENDNEDNKQTRPTSTTTTTSSSSAPHERRPFANVSVVLLRNPQTAIPSWFNALYEARHDQKAHSEQAPEEAWNEWRDKNFFAMALPLWKQFVQAWSNTSTTTTTTTTRVGSNNSSSNNNSHVRPLHSYDSYDTLPHLPKAGAIDFHFQINLYLPYEDMISVERGPDLIRRLANELHRCHFPVPTMATTSDQRDDGNDAKISSERMQNHQGMSISSSSSSSPSSVYYCWWKAVVQDRPIVKRSHRYVPRFTLPQLRGMLNVVGELMNEFRYTNPSLHSILTMYQNEIETTKGNTLLLQDK